MVDYLFDTSYYTSTRWLSEKYSNNLNVEKFRKIDVNYEFKTNYYKLIHQVMIN